MTRQVLMLGTDEQQFSPTAVVHAYKRERAPKHKKNCALDEARRNEVSVCGECGAPVRFSCNFLLMSQIIRRHRRPRTR